MMTAEKWYEYQTCYKKYGLDMKPKDRKEQKKCGCHDKSVIPPKEKIRLLLLTIFAGLLGICLIITAAYSAQVKYRINGLLAESDVIRGEIENLNVEIKSSVNIAVIEDKAINELGMIYPDLDQIAYITPTKDNMNDFALTLKQIAFNN